MNGISYRDHGSPVRRARETARRSLPCRFCQSEQDPKLRRPRYLSAAWRRDPSAYFACADCGHRFETLAGAASMRDSELPEDRIPDPEGLLVSLDLAARLESMGNDRTVMPLAETALDLVRSGIDGSSRSVSSRVSGTTVGFVYLGRPWIEISLCLAESGEKIDLAGRASRLLGNAITDPEARFVVGIASADSWQLADSSPGVELSRIAALRDATSFSLEGNPWQVRAYRLDSGG